MLLVICMAELIPRGGEVPRGVRLTLTGDSLSSEDGRQRCR